MPCMPGIYIRQTIITLYNDIEKLAEAAPLVHHQDNHLVADQGNTGRQAIIVHTGSSGAAGAPIAAALHTPHTLYLFNLFQTKSYSIVRLERCFNRDDIIRQANHEG